MTALATSTTPPLNAGQEKAAEGFFQFLFSDKTEFCISGPAGVGKTFLMGHLIDKVMPRYHQSCRLFGIDPIYNQVEMTATTNKAAEVLGLATGRPTRTVHSFLGLRVFDDFSTGKSRLEKSANWKVHSRLILFVDESSQVDFRLRRYIQEGTIRSKIVYVGDHCQLGPVGTGEETSPIYKDNLPFYELTEPMRTDNPHLQAINEQLRNTVKTGEFKPIKTVPGVIDLLDGDQMEKEVQSHFMDPDNQDRILAYTNKRVVMYNDYIREMRGLPPLLTVGEHVINNSAIQMPTGGMMATEDEFQVIEVASGPKDDEIEPGVELEVLRCTLKGRHATFPNVKVPTDRDHYNELIKYYKKQKNWRMFYQLKNNYPDLRPRDAATGHKAQGSTYNTVFIDLEDLSTCRDKSTAARLLYVTFSRARKRVVLCGRLAPKFGGVITP